LSILRTIPPRPTTQAQHPDTTCPHLIAPPPPHRRARARHGRGSSGWSPHLTTTSNLRASLRSMCSVGDLRALPDTARIGERWSLTVRASERDDLQRLPLQLSSCCELTVRLLLLIINIIFLAKRNFQD
jgi:hypothetical protein